MEITIVADCDADLAGTPAENRVGRRCQFRFIGLTPALRPLQRRARQRQTHQHKGGSGFRTANENTGRGLHLVPLIGLERSMATTFAEMAHDAMEWRCKARHLGAEMPERDSASAASNGFIS